MKILFVSHTTELRYGATTSLAELLMLLRRVYRVEPTVLVPKRGSFSRFLEKNGIPVIQVNYWRPWIYPGGRFLRHGIKNAVINALYFPFVLSYFKKHKHHFDLIHTNSSIIHIGAYLSSKLDIPHIWHVREYAEEHYHLKYYLGKSKAMAYMEKRSEAIVTVSKALKTRYGAFISPAKLIAIHNGIVFTERSVERNFPSDNRRPIVFLVAGLIHESKNQLEVLQALHRLVNEQQYRSIRVVFAGSGDDAYLKSLQAFISDHQLETYVECKGYVEDMDELRKHADVAIVSSRFEAFGKVAIEAMLAKMPVIGAISGGIPEIIKDGETGYLYPPGDVERLSSLMRQFIDQPELIECFAHVGFELAKNRFTMDQNAKHIFQLYQTILEKRSP